MFRLLESFMIFLGIVLFLVLWGIFIGILHYLNVVSDDNVMICFFGGAFLFALSMTDE